MLKRFDEFVNSFLLERKEEPKGSYKIARPANKRGEYKKGMHLNRRLTHDKDSKATKGSVFFNRSQEKSERVRKLKLLRRGMAPIISSKKHKKRKIGSKAKRREDGNIPNIQDHKKNWKPI